MIPSSESEAQANPSSPNPFWQRFWLTFLVVSLGYAGYCFYVPSNNIAWSADLTTAQAEAAESDKPIIMFFTGTWCVPCRIMKRQVWADWLVAAKVNTGFVPVLIDVDDASAAEALNRYGVGYTPRTIITDSKGDVLQQHAGGMSKTAFLEMLDSLNE